MALSDIINVHIGRGMYEGRSRKAPARNWSREARRLGWAWDEGGPHWYRNIPGASPFAPYQYAKTAREAVEAS